MFDKIRDVSAVHTLTHELGRLREAYMDAVLAGNDPEPSFWTEGEERAFALEREAHFSWQVRTFLDPEDHRSDQEAWDDRDCVMGEEVALWSHRRLVEIPFVGSGTHDVPEALAEVAAGARDGSLDDPDDRVGTPPDQGNGLSDHAIDAQGTPSDRENGGRSV